MSRELIGSKHVASRRAVIALAVAAIAALGAVPAGASRAVDVPPGNDADAKVTPIDVRALASPSPVLGADGLVHLAYELQIANLNDKVVDFTSVAVVDPAADDDVITDVDAATLATTMRIDGADFGSTLAAGVGAVLFMDVTLDKDAAVPRDLEHHFSYTLGGTPLEFTGVPVRVDRRAPIVVSPPLTGNRWIVGNGCCADVTAHRGATLPIDGTIHVPERFAIDFVQLDAAGKLFEGPIGDTASYGYFGNDVLAAAPGTVVGIQDGLPEQTPGSLPTDATVQTAGGNYIVVDIGHGRFAFYAHLQPASLTVKKGDKVATGDVLGKLGNTGNTDGPHLHFHIMDGPSPLLSNGLPFELTAFTVEGKAQNIDAIQKQGAVAEIDDSLAGRHHDELPLNLEVIGFPHTKT